MKYIVRKTSLWDEQPVEEAIKTTVHWFDIRNSVVKDPNRKYLWEDFVKQNRDIIQLPNGHWRGINKIASEVWVVEIDDLLSFVDKCKDSIIISKPSCEEGYYELEIYDTYRE